MHSQGVCPGELTCGLRMCVTSKESMHSCLWTPCTHAVASGVEIRRQTIGAGSLLPPRRFPGYNLPHQPWQHGLCPQRHLPGPETCIPDQSPGNAGAAMQGTHLKDTGMHWCYSPTTARRNSGPPEVGSIVCCGSHRTQPLSAYVPSTRHALRLRHQTHKIRVGVEWNLGIASKWPGEVSQDYQPFQTCIPYELLRQSYKICLHQNP